MSLPNGLNLSVQRGEDRNAAALAYIKAQHEKDEPLIARAVAIFNKRIAEGEAEMVHTFYSDRLAFRIEHTVYGSVQDADRAANEIGKRICAALPKRVRPEAEVSLAKGRNCLRIHKENEDGWAIGCALLFMVPAPFIMLPVLYDRIVKRYVISVTFSVNAN